MWATPWICRRCVKSLRPSVAAQFLRRASTTTDTGISLPPSLLTRAKKIATEHAELSKSIADDYDVAKSKRVGELASTAALLREWEEAKEGKKELEAMLQSSDKELRELAHDELESTEENLDRLAKKLSASMIPKHPFGHMPCIIEFRPGPGGLEGRFFADTLYMMYKAYCERTGVRTRLMSYELADAAGDQTGSEGENPLQEAVLEILDEGAYDLFRGEAGMHRVQRVPVTESKGRTHTSAVAVWVLPSFPEGGTLSNADINDPESDFYINPADVRQEAMRSSGAGGQHVNKVESCIRLTHVPTGTVVRNQETRSQSQNKEKAWALLRSRIAQQKREAREEEATKLRNSVLARGQITRGDKIRTYNYSQDRCSDHRSGINLHNLPDILAGGEGLDKVMASAKEWMVNQEIENLIADDEAAAKQKTSKTKK